MTGPAPGPHVVIEPSGDLPLVSMMIGQLSGSECDPPGRAGLTRLVARLMRRTGGGLDPHELDVAVDSLGASLSADVSHSTATFHATVIERSLDAFVDLLVQVLAQPGFAENELQRLKRETLGELVETLDNDRSLVRRWFRSRMFPDHPFGRSVSGTPTSIDAITPDDVARLYRRTVTAGNLAFGFAGDVTEAQAQSIAQRIVLALPDGTTPIDTASEPTGPQGRRLVIVDKPERTQTQILIGGLGSHPHDDDHIALHVANTVFGGTFTARMTREIRSERGWSYGAYSSLPVDRHRRDFSMWTFPKADDAADCIRLQLSMLREWRERGVTAEELAWAKSYLVRSHAFAIDTAAKRAALALDEVLYGLPAGYYRDYTSQVDQITLEQANAAVRRRIPDEDLLVTVVGTEQEIGTAVRDAIDGLDAVEVVPFDGEA